MELYPLSPLQQGMLFHWLRDPRSGTDIEQIVVDLHHEVDSVRLERAWNNAVARFDTLRTVFRWRDLDAPMQGIGPRAAFAMSVEDLRGSSSTDQDARTQEHLSSDRANGFDLAESPALRVTLFLLADTRARLVWSFHHILIDGRSFEEILNAVFDEYDGVMRAPSVSQPYRTYVDWLVAQDYAEMQGFWREKLRSFTATTPVPHSDVQSKHGGQFGQRDTTLSPEITKRLRDIAQTEEVSLNTIIMGAWALLLSRHSGELDVVFGATKTTRRGTIPDADAMVGNFLATIPVRVAIAPSAPVAEWLRSIRREWVSLRGSEHLPLVEIKQVTALPASAPLFDTLVVFETYQFGNRLSAQGPLWSDRHFQLYEQTGLPLTLMAYDGHQLALKIDFDARLYEAATVDRLLSELEVVLNAWGTDVSAPLGDTPILAPDEHRAVVHEWNATWAALPSTASLGTLLEEQAARSPDAVAVTSGNEHITYRALNTRANQLAHELIRCGVGPDALVGVCLERSVDMIVALVAVVKAGGAYVPLDPSFPLDRLEFMAEDAGLTVLLTEPHLAQRLGGFTGPRVHLSDPSWNGNDVTAPVVEVSPEDLAYVIYTSGSTGRPKGVEVSRGAFVNFLWTMRDKPGIAERDTLAAVTTISFDIAGLELFLPLITGARILLVTRETAVDGAALRELLETSGATMLQATPITWRLLFDAGWTGGEGFTALVGGEALPAELAERIASACGCAWNMYGPTETTVWSSLDRVRIGNPITIGRPIANTTMYVLNAQLKPLPIGATGELFIGGFGVARGYRNRPDLTAERFLPDPFRAGGRLYRTGDLARFRTDGMLECLGRSDGQVKLRGFRVELGEIETALDTLPAIRQAVVVLREDVPGDKRLVAYYTSDVPLTVTTLREHLKASLPDYMVPTAFVSVATFPLTANGKVDRRMLPAPEHEAPIRDRKVTRPRTYVEQQLSEIWEDLFSIERVSVDDDFFDLGGHSLLAVSMMGKISRTFGKSLPLNALFEAPTIALLAKRIESDSNVAGAHTLVSIHAAGTKPPIYWIPGGAALGLFSLRDIVTRLGDDQPVYGLGSSLPKTLDEVQTVEQRAAQYVELIRRNQPSGPYCLAGFCAGGRVAFEMAHQLNAVGEQVAFLGMINCWFPNYPVGRARRLLMRAQRLLFRLRKLSEQVRSSSANGTTPLDHLRAKLASRRSAKADRARVAAATQEVREQGFGENTAVYKEVALAATLAVFDRYEPRPYPGAASLFISDDEEVAGVSRGLDPRLAWRRVTAEHEILTFPGGHELQMPHAPVFAETLKTALENALANHRTRI